MPRPDTASITRQIRRGRMCDNSDELEALKNLQECRRLAGWTDAVWKQRLAGHNKEWAAKMKERCVDAAVGGSSAGAKLKFEWVDSQIHPNPRKGYEDLKEASLAIDDLFDANESGWQLDKPRGGVTSLLGVKHKFIRMISPADDPDGHDLRVRVLELENDFLFQDGIVVKGQQDDDDEEEEPPPKKAKAGKSTSPEEAGEEEGEEAGEEKDKKKKKKKAEEQPAAAKGRRGKAPAPEAAPPAEEDGGGDGKRKRRKAARAE